MPVINRGTIIVEDGRTILLIPLRLALYNFLVESTIFLHTTYISVCRVAINVVLVNVAVIRVLTLQEYLLYTVVRVLRVNGLRFLTYLYSVNV